MTKQDAYITLFKAKGGLGMQTCPRESMARHFSLGQEEGAGGLDLSPGSYGETGNETPSSHEDLFLRG